MAGGAILGSTMGASRADASDAKPAQLHWKCVYIDECGAGDKSCCFTSGSGSGHSHCSTNCVINVT
jgi:hypothetical protein